GENRTGGEIYWGGVNGGVWAGEMRGGGGKDRGVLKPYRESMTKRIAVGAVSHRTLQVESPEEVAAFIHRALDCIKLENLALTSDCGFGRQGANRLIAFYKAAAIVQGANILRHDL